jgi:predicted acyltransferase
MSDASPTGQRLVSLDQFRGYTVLGMILVNFVGGFETTHYQLKHHNTFCSYADTIMPQFFFAVGFAFRLTFVQRIRTHGATAAYLRVVRRLFGLVLVAMAVYTLGFVYMIGIRTEMWEQLHEPSIWGVFKPLLKKYWFQTLMHIATTSLWILPVIRCRAGIRIAFMLASAALHMFLSHLFNFSWVNGQLDGIAGIDGGPLGFLTWTIPTIVGTLSCDAIVGTKGRSRLLSLTLCSLGLIVLGYLFSCGSKLYDIPAGRVDSQSTEIFSPQPVFPPQDLMAAARMKLRQGDWSELLVEPPFVPPQHPEGEINLSYQFRLWNYWMMSQRVGAISYLTFSAGFSLAVYLLFYVSCDLFGKQLGVFRTFGTNALAAYVLHIVVSIAINSFMTRDASAWYMWAGCAVFMGIIYLLVRTLEKNQIFIKV